MVREFIVKKDVVTAAQYPLFCELINKIVDNYNAQIKYVSSSPVLPPKSIARNPAAPRKEIISAFEMPGFAGNPAMTAVQAVRLEASLIKQPDDLETHRELLFYYSNHKIKDTPARFNARIRHYTWMVEHYPESTEIQVLGPIGLASTIESEEFKRLWPVWTKAVDKDKSNTAVRLNAFEYAKHFDTQIPEQLLNDGMKLDPANFEFPLKLSELFSKPEDPARTESDVEKAERINKELKYGQTALDLLKTERSSERTDKRFRLLENLAKAAFDAGEFASAKKLATELILDFGQESYSANYDSATHIGNIVLGRVALKEKNIAKAGEYLLIAIKAPLRKETSWLPEIDTDLARELLAAGQKDVVLEYLKLCENLSNLSREKSLFADTIRSLKKWQLQIAAGQTPSWDFYRP